MPSYIFTIGDEPDGEPEATGYVRASGLIEAFHLVGHPETTLYPLPADAAWPGGAREHLLFTDRDGAQVARPKLKAAWPTEYEPPVFIPFVDVARIFAHAASEILRRS